MGALDNWTKQAVALHRAGQYLDAAKCYRSALDRNKRDVDSRLGLAKAYFDHVMSQQQGRALTPDILPPELGVYLDIALKELLILVSERSSLAQAWGLLGTIYGYRREMEAAERAYRKAVRLDASSADSKHSLGLVLYEQKKYEEAAEIFSKASAMSPLNPRNWHMLGEASFQAGDLVTAVSAYERAIGLAPGVAESYGGLARAHRYRGDYQASRRVLEAAVARRDCTKDNNVALAANLLMLKDWAPGWRFYVCRYSTPHNVPAPEDFRFEAAGRRLLMRFDQGLGDELFFLRFLPRLREKGAALVYHTHRKLYPLLRGNPLFAGVEIADEMENAVYDLLVGDLPLVTQMRADEDIPPAFRLEVDASRLAVLRDQLLAFGPAPYIGLTWQGGTPGVSKLLFKEIQPHELGCKLSNLPGTFVMLQRNPVEADVQAMEKGLGRAMLDMSGLNDDLQGMLALLSLLDEYVGVSNTNMHLLAGIGKTARVLVPYPPDWRWLAGGDESPWFPGFKVYRQSRDKGWGEALTMLTRDLAEKHPLRGTQE